MSDNPPSRLAERCSANRIGGGFHQIRCSRYGIIKRYGKQYCHQHDPITVAAFNEAREERWQKKWAARDAATEARKREDERQTAIMAIIPDIVEWASKSAVRYEWAEKLVRVYERA